MIEMIEFILPIFSVGNIIFQLLITEYSESPVSILSWVTLGLGIIHASKNIIFDLEIINNNNEILLEKINKLIHFFLKKKKSFTNGFI
jgi:hypothetical protein